VLYPSSWLLVCLDDCVRRTQRELTIPFTVSIGGSLFAMNFIVSKQALWLEAIEKRISATSSMLNSMKGIKMSGLKQTLFDNLQKLRVDELRISKQFRRLLIWNMIFGNTPSLLSFARDQISRELTGIQPMSPRCLLRS
jgi:hypothetical protein